MNQIHLDIKLIEGRYQLRLLLSADVYLSEIPNDLFDTLSQVCV